MDKLTVFVDRLDNIGVKLSIAGNFPWVYIDKIDGVKVTEKFQANHGFCVAYLPIRKDQDIKFTDIGETFKLIRKYVKQTTKK